MTSLEQRREALREEFRTKRGFWSEWHEALVTLNVDMFETYLRMNQPPPETILLSKKLREFVYVAVDIATSHLYVRGTHIHAAAAIREGATKEELAGVLQLVSLQGFHTLKEAMPILEQELRRLPGAAPSAKRDPSVDVQEAKAVLAQFGDDPDGALDALATLSPQYFIAYARYVRTARASSALEPKVQELLLLAMSAAPTHLCLPQVRIHIRLALAAGASAGEVAEVLALASAIGIHTFSIGAPIVVEELKRAGIDVR